MSAACVGKPGQTHMASDKGGYGGCRVRHAAKTVTLRQLLRPANAIGKEVA